jgi:hypothetical protein
MCDRRNLTELFELYQQITPIVVDGSMYLPSGDEGLYVFARPADRGSRWGSN